MNLYLIGSSTLYSVDTRVKWVGAFTVALIVLAIPIFTWAVYILLFSILLSSAIATHLPLKQVFSRTLLIEIPVLLVLIPLPFIKEARPLVEMTLLGISVRVSLGELMRISALLVRSWLIILTMALFTMTTPPDRIFSSLASMGFPTILVNTILLMWRYLSLLSEQARTMSNARELRSIQPHTATKRKRVSVLWKMKSAGSMLGGLFIRAYERSERIYQAMQLRGFDGTFQTMETQPLSTPQILQIFGIVVMGMCFIIGAYGL